MWRIYRKTALVLAKTMEEDFEVETLEGTMRGKSGDYLCRGIHGELWPVAKDIFELTYLEVDSK